LAKPISLSVRLFGNIFGEDKLIVVLAGMVALSKYFLVKYIPVQFPMLLFAVLTSFIQALIFTVLTAVYISIMVSHGDETHGATASH
jgi:F-type H+-transporting ATPase subunit a